jgi:hypothetical protein
METTNDSINITRYIQHLKGKDGRQKTFPRSKISSEVHDETCRSITAQYAPVLRLAVATSCKISMQSWHLIELEDGIPRSHPPPKQKSISRAQSLTECFDASKLNRYANLVHHNVSISAKSPRHPSRATQQWSRYEPVFTVKSPLSNSRGISPCLL